MRTFPILMEGLLSCRDCALAYAHLSVMRSDEPNELTVISLLGKVKKSCEYEI